MNEQFDRALRNHIRDTFDHYDDLMADDGWKQFNKQRNRKKRGLIFWYALPSGIAAALALLWIFNTTTNDVVKHENKFIAKNKTIAVPKNVNPSIEKPIFNINKGKMELAKPKNTSLNRNLNEAENSNVFVVAKKATYRDRYPVAKLDVHQKVLHTLETDYKQPFITIDERNLLATNIQTPEKQDYLAFNNDLLKDRNMQPKSVSPKKDVAKKDKTAILNFSVDANTYYSFTSGGVNNDLNLGVGFLSEFRLTKHLSVNSGISINRQSAIYQGSDNQSSRSQGFSAVASSPSTLITSLSKQSISIPEATQINAKLIGFDIPLNLKYNILMGKTKTFVSTGISSYSLLNQSYANDVSVINYSLTSAPSTTILRTVDEQKENAFSNFQFARTINFSFGILYPVSTKNSISVEPFVKYPIAGFGQRDLEIGSGGISFKLNFGK
nr:hypothetical protein [uncultured Pedobacter sp.]